MKEATGELSMTAVVVVVIGILAVALPLIINSVVNSMERSANCRAAFGCKTNQCTADNRTMECQYVPEAGEATVDKTTGTATIYCPCDEEYTN